MKNVILKGPILTQSGYGVHGMQIARWLISRSDINLKVILTPWGDTPWLIDSTSHNGFVGEVMKRTSQNIEQGDVSFQLQLPNEWDTRIARFNIGVTAGVETDRCNPEWIKNINAMNMIIVPSTHVKSCFMTSGDVKVPIHVVPEAFIDSCLLEDEKLPTLPEFSTPFNFLVFGQVTGNNPHNDRKNIFFTIKWLTETFKNDPNVGIVVKTNTGRNSKRDKVQTINMFNQVAKEARCGADGPKIHLLHGELDDLEIAALYKHPQIKALVTLTRGEGFGLPILEAAACGLPVIATNWSGHLDFLNQGKFINVMYNLSEVHNSRIDKNIFIKGARWAEPNENDFKKKVLKFKNSSFTPKQWAIELKEKLHATHTFEQISKCYDKVTSEVF